MAYKVRPLHEEVLRLYTIKEVAEICKVNEKTVLRWVRTGFLPASKLGGNWRVDHEDLKKFLKDNRNIQKEG